MSRAALEDAEKLREKHALSSYQEEYNDDDFAENYDIEKEKNRIVESSPKRRFIRFNEELGSGAYKTVYKAYDNETGWEVAWNVIKLQRLPDKERKRISDEIALLKQLKHPNIIHFISAWINRQKDEVIFITEAVTGGSLKRFLKKIKIPRLKVIKTWCREILQGIEYLHNLEPYPIIHRDIKCDNIFINSNKGEIRIGDLGLATFMSHAYADSVLGTPEFMAPEMYEEVYGPSVDIYSFGMCVLEIVTNQTPYSECMNAAQIYKKVSKGIKPCSLNLIANEEVKNFIFKCLKPKDERPTASELLKYQFLTTTDPELDNQPVELFEAPMIPKVEEDDRKESMKVNEKTQKLYQQALEIDENEHDQENREKSDSSRDEEKKRDEDSSPQTGGNSIRSDTHKVVNFEKSTPEGQSSKYKSTDYSSSPNQQHHPWQKEEVKSLPPQSRTEELKLVANNGPEEHKREEHNEHIQIRKEHVVVSDHASRHPEKKHIQGSYEQKSEKGKASRKHKQLNEEEAKGYESRKHQEEIHTHHTPSTNRDSNRYYFSSKGISHNFLIIAIRYEGHENQHEHIIEIKKEKVSAEKIKRKLWKHLDLLNPSDPYFLHQLNILCKTVLFENLASQNLLPPGNLASFFNSIAQARSVTNESQKSPDRSVLTNNPNTVYFQLQHFNKSYKRYLAQIPKEYIIHESEEAMNLRHQREILELENIHLLQKRNMWDRRQNIMSNSFHNATVSNGQHLDINILDADDFYQKSLHLQEVSSRSAKKKGSQGSGLSISSVDSAPFSPTYSSGNHISSINNWAETTSSKKDDHFAPALDETTRISLLNSEHTNDIERTTTINIDSTPMGQLGLQEQAFSNTNVPTHTISPKGGSNPGLPTKHNASSFAAHAIKSTIIKTQSDKSGSKEKKPIDAVEKEVDVPLVKRPSIERNLESAQNLAQALLSHTQNQSAPQNIPSSSYSSNLHTVSNSQQQSMQEHEKSGKDVSQELRKEIKPEKPPISANLSSPPEKASQNSQVLHEMSQIKPPVKPLTINSQQNIAVTNQKKLPHGPLSNPNQLPNGYNFSSPPQIDTSSSNVRHGVITHNQNSHQGQAWMSQPNSATFKTNSGSNQGSNPPNIHTNINASKPIHTNVSTNPTVQKMLITNQNSVGSFPKSNQPLNSVQPAKKGNGTSQTGQHGPTSDQLITRSTSVKTNDMSHSTHIKLQSTELLDNVKNHKMKGVLKRLESDMDAEDVKMLQICLELLTESDILPNGNFSHYTENVLKTCQESLSLVPNGIVDNVTWGKMLNALEKKAEKKKFVKDISKQKDMSEGGKGQDDIKKKIKDKQNKEASECLNKIESNLIDLSDLK